MIRWRRRGRALPEDADVVIARHLDEWRYLDREERVDLRDRTEALLATKGWEAAHGFELTDAMCTVIAANAALVVLGLDLDLYRDVQAIVVHPTRLTITRPRPGPIPGSMTEGPLDLDGEAHHRRGPVVLAWDAVRRDTQHRGDGRNVVVHELAHKLDMLDGMVDGTPPLAEHGVHRRWVEVCGPEYESLRAGAADPVLRDEAGADPGEFFAIAVEAFFDRPTMLAEHKPQLYDVLRTYFAQDPVARRG